MKILQIAPKIPLPLDEGGRIGIYNITKYLYLRDHKIDLVVYKKNLNYEFAYKELSKICNPYIIDVKTENSIIGAFFNIFSKIPYNISKYYSRKLIKFLEEYFEKNSVDLIHVDHLHMAWCVEHLRKLTDAPIVLREHNFETKIMQRFSQNQKNFFLRKFSQIQYKKFLRYEPKLTEKFNKCIMVSKEDEKLLKEMNPNVETSVVEVGIDKQLLKIIKKDLIPYSMFHLGSMEWFPNFEGLNWYLNEIFSEIVSRIPQVKLFLYGKGTEKLNIPSIFSSNIIKAGYIKNIWEEISDKQLAIVPLRIGSGMRVKIIEMLGIGQSIISTSIGKEGIEVEDGKQILIADSVNDFVEKTDSFFKNAYDSALISKNAKKIIEEKYTWEKIAEKFENEYQNLVNRKIN